MQNLIKINIVNSGEVGDGESFKTTCMEGDIEPSFVVRVTKEIIRLHRSKSSFRKQSQQNSVDSKNKKPSFKTKQ
ncbi:hypothetical protein [Candidatus Tisiphia endosymbiont of Sialis lutaria]|uniref:hypothetical protein n=1 Tax=Candidatus Tisiphia endosymbiont of Sialis lutaria TaxID=2029164 RepID=UPI00312C8F1C